MADPALVTSVLYYLGITLGLVLLVKYLLGSKSTTNIPPFPAQPYAILGHLPYLKKGMRNQMKEWGRKAGDIYSIKFGPRLMVVLNSYAAVHEAFVKQADAFSDRTPQSFIHSVSSQTGILTSSGQIWKEQRTIALQILRSFGMGKNILAQKISEEVSAYMDALGQLGGQPIDVRSLTNTAVSNVICSIIVGKRFDYEDTYFAKLLELLNEQVRLMATSNLSNIFPWLHYVPGDTFQSKKRMENYHYIRTFFCVHHIEKTENEFDEDNKDNFISAYLAEMKKAERQGRETTLNKENLSRVLLNLFGAGSETTSTTMLWFMVYMLHYPHIQNKVYREIEDVVGTERVPAMQDRPRLNYTNAVIMETQRLASIVPVGVPHYTQTEATVMGYTVPAGTTVLSNLDTVLWDGDTWENPMDFRPERFLDDQGKITQPEQFMPFSIGRRLCLGESMARMELYLFLAALVQRFEFAPEVPDQLPLRVPLDGITSPPVKFKIRFVDRRST